MILIVASWYSKHHVDDGMEMKTGSQMKRLYREATLKKCPGMIYDKMAKALAWFFSNTT